MGKLNWYIVEVINIIDNLSKSEGLSSYFQGFVRVTKSIGKRLHISQLSVYKGFIYFANIVHHTYSGR